MMFPGRQQQQKKFNQQLMQQQALYNSLLGHTRCDPFIHNLQCQLPPYSYNGMMFPSTTTNGLSTMTLPPPSPLYGLQQQQQQQQQRRLLNQFQGNIGSITQNKRDVTKRRVEETFCNPDVILPVSHTSHGNSMLLSSSLSISADANVIVPPNKKQRTMKDSSINNKDNKTTTATTKKALKKVTFNHNQIKVHFCPPMSKDDIKESWYNDNEYMDFRMDSRRTISAFIKADFDVDLLDPNIHCLRGIEDYLTMERMKRRKKLLKGSVKCILRQQQKLRKQQQQQQNDNNNDDMGKVNPRVTLQMISMMNSKNSRWIAIQRGEMDATCTLPNFIIL